MRKILLAAATMLMTVGIAFGSGGPRYSYSQATPTEQYSVYCGSFAWTDALSVWTSSLSYIGRVIVDGKKSLVWSPNIYTNTITPVGSSVTVNGAAYISGLISGGSLSIIGNGTIGQNLTSKYYTATSTSVFRTTNFIEESAPTKLYIVDISSQNGDTMYRFGRAYYGDREAFASYNYAIHKFYVGPPGSAYGWLGYLNATDTGAGTDLVLRTITAGHNTKVSSELGNVILKSHGVGGFTLSQSSAVFTVPPIIPTKTLGQLKVYTPYGPGELWRCSDTTPMSIFMSTGTTAFGFIKFSGGVTEP